MSEERKEIVINLDKLDSTEVRGENELIFQEQFDQLVYKIRRKAKENKDRLPKQEGCRDKMKDDEARGVPSCFFIDGTRGSGKSTLMRAVRAELIKNEGNQEGLYPLADVDPTELGKGENFFLYLLTRIHVILEKRFKNNSDCDDEIDKIRAAIEDLRKMLGGLQVLMDSDEALKKSTAPDFFLENCIDRCADSMLLRKKLCELLGKVAKIVGKEIFLVTIDDADLNFSKCEDVLEYVRKYMQTPRLIFLFAGDMQLYSHVVRGIHMRSFGNVLLQHDVSHKDHRNKMVDCLEEQYLLKIFPADNRCKMPSIGEFQNSRKCRLMVRFSTLYKVNNERGIPLYSCIRRYIYPICGAGTSRTVEVLLRNLPLRSVLFLVQDWIRSTMGMMPASEGFVRAVSDCLQKISASVLVRSNINCRALSNHNMSVLVRMLINYLNERKLWKSNINFSPVGENTDELLISVCLGAVVAATTQGISEKLLYMLSLYPQQYRLNELYSERFDRGEVGPSMRDSAGYSELGAIASACTAPLVASGSNYSKRYGSGVIRLMQDAQLQDKEKGSLHRISFSALGRQISDALSAHNDMLVGMGIANSICSIQEGTEKSYYISIYNLVLHVVEWLEIGNKYLHDEKSELDENSQEKINELTSIVKEKLSYPTFCASVSREKAKNDIGAAHSEDEDDEKQKYFVIPGLTGDYGEIIEEYVDWIKRYASITQTTPPEVYSLCWSRFMWRCESETKKYALRFDDLNRAPKAGNLLKAYMKAFEDSLQQSFSLFADEENGVCACVKNFPLWRALSEADEDKSILFKSLNKVNMGALRYKGYMDIVKAAQESLSLQTEKLEAAEESLSDEEFRLYKIEDSAKLAFEQWHKELSKASSLAKNEKDYLAQETAAQEYVAELRQRVKDLWESIKETEMQVASLRVKVGVTHQESELKELGKALRIKNSSLRRSKNLQVKERIQREIREIEEKIKAANSKEDVYINGAQMSELAEKEALLKVLNSQLTAMSKELIDAQKAWASAQKNTPRVRKELYASQEECKRLEEIWKSRDAELKKEQQKIEKMKETVKKVREDQKKAKRFLEKTKESDEVQ